MATDDMKLTKPCTDVCAGYPDARCKSSIHVNYLTTVAMLIAATSYPGNAGPAWRRVVVQSFSTVDCRTTPGVERSKFAMRAVSQ
eukprot:943499-Pleurochrysis_carterae.AAC.1